MTTDRRPRSELKPHPTGSEPAFLAFGAKNTVGYFFLADVDYTEETILVRETHKEDAWQIYPVSLSSSKTILK